MYRVRLAAPLLAASALLATAMTPALAAAPQGQVRCSVGWAGSSEHIVLDYGSLRSGGQTAVEQEAAMCSYLISTGSFVGVSKLADWGSNGYVPVCTVSWDSTEATDVWAYPRDGAAASDMFCHQDDGSERGVTFY